MVVDQVELYMFSRHLIEALARTRPQFNHDLDQFSIYLVFLLGSLQHRASGKSGPPPEVGINALSISQICGVPRESTRRKLRALQLAGLIRRDSDGLWRLADPNDALLHDALAPLLDLVARRQGSVHGSGGNSLSKAGRGAAT